MLWIGKAKPDSRVLASAREKAAGAASLEDKRLAQIHLESVEHLWKISRQLARERFEHAREDARRELQAVVDRVRPGAGPHLPAALESAVEAFHGKEFARARELAAEIRRVRTAPAPVRVVPAVRAARAPEPDSVALLDEALRCERNNQLFRACRLYLQVLERQPGNPGARQRLQAVRGRQSGGRA